MYKTKKRMILIISLVLIILLAVIASLAILYLNTDLFKSNKDLFYKYIQQNGIITELANFSELDKYLDKSESLPHTYDSTLKFTENSSDSTQLNSFNVEITGKNDPINQNESLDLKLKYGDAELFHINGIKNNNLYGVLSEEIVTKYIAVENNNLKEFATKLGIENTEKLPNKIKTNNYLEIFSLTEEQKINIFNVFKPILIDNLSNDYFTRQNDVPLLLNNNNITTKTYVLCLNEKQLNDILQNILVTAKNSGVILNIVKDKARILGYEENAIDEIVREYQDLAQEQINNISVENTQNEALKIILYTADGKLLKTNIIIHEDITVEMVCSQNDTQVELNITINEKESSDQTTFQIVKYVTSDKFEYSITTNLLIDNSQNKIVFKAEKNGDSSSSQIKDAVSFGINDGVSINRIDYTNVENYQNDVNIERLNSSNSVTLNNYSSDEIQNLIEAIIGRMEQVYQEKIIELENMNISLNSLLPYTIWFNSRNTIDESNNTMTSLEIQAFNSIFMPYSGSDTKGSNVKALISAIIASNTSYENDSSKQISLSFGDYIEVIDVQELKNLSDQINSSSSYKVILNYAAEGIVNKITIEENQQ